MLISFSSNINPSKIPIMQYDSTGIGGMCDCRIYGNRVCSYMRNSWVPLETASKKRIIFF